MQADALRLERMRDDDHGGRVRAPRPPKPADAEEQVLRRVGGALLQRDVRAQDLGADAAEEAAQAWGERGARARRAAGQGDEAAGVVEVAPSPR